MPEDDAQTFLQSLKFDNLSADEFKSTWAACAKFRINQIRYESENMQESLKLWPQYKKPNGLQLVRYHICIISTYKFIINVSKTNALHLQIDFDFGIIHQNAEKIIDWEHKFERLFEYMKNHLILHDKDAKKILNTLNRNQLKEGNIV